MYQLSCFSLVLFLAALPIAGASEAPVVAPKPVKKSFALGCAECRFLSQPSRSTRILPTQAGPTLPPVDDMPGPLPHAFDAKPLPGATGRTPLSDLVNEYLPDLSADEQRVWVEELRALPPEIARDLLAARSRVVGPQSLPNPAEGGLVPPPEQSEPLPELDAALRRVPDAISEHIGGGTTTIEILRQAEAVLLHNIANADTYGYKRLMPLTQESAARGGLQGLSIRRDERTGRLEKTGRRFDLAIEGAGLFQVRNGEIIALLRCGTFEIGDDGKIVTKIAGSEWSLYPAVEIPVEVATVEIDHDGRIACELPGEGEVVVVGQIELARIGDFSSLESVGGGLFAVPEEAEPVAVGRPGEESLGVIRQGYLERSNVAVTAEIAALNRLRLQISIITGNSPQQLASPAADGPRQ